MKNLLSWELLSHCQTKKILTVNFEELAPTFQLACCFLIKSLVPGLAYFDELLNVWRKIKIVYLWAIILIIW